MRDTDTGLASAHALLPLELTIFTLARSFPVVPILVMWRCVSAPRYCWTHSSHGSHAGAALIEGFFQSNPLRDLFAVALAEWTVAVSRTYSSEARRAEGAHTHSTRTSPALVCASLTVDGLRGSAGHAGDGRTQRRRHRSTRKGAGIAAHGVRWRTA